MAKACCCIADLRPEPAIISTVDSSCACAGILTCHQQQALIAWINIIPFWIGKTSVVRALSQNLLCPCVLPCEVWLYSRGHPFPLLVDSTFQRMDEALVDGCLAIFPRHKGVLVWSKYSGNKVRMSPLPA
ncbi:uncharacterized protein LOC124318103 isoform X1 [Daphnia pulicaria]|uniref:uncharacterized protein LOC124318103 isoform X1 n=1 Tax=Daphnia pulicaria TaxID=35523 RepID=UPI001EEC0FD2|nr:uncharacterized protein LOC124318103 isoform X1 [Daphnia pulicaria]